MDTLQILLRIQFSGVAAELGKCRGPQNAYNPVSFQLEQGQYYCLEPPS